MAEVVLPKYVNQLAVDILGKLTDQVFCLDETGNILYANSAACDQLGYELSLMTSLNIFDLSPRTTQENWSGYCEQVRSSGTYNYYAYYQDKKGDNHPVEIMAMPFFPEKNAMLICNLVRAVQESARYRQLLESATAEVQIGGWEWVPENGRILVSRECLRLFETKDEDAVQLSALAGRFPEHRREEWATAVTALLREDVSFSFTAPCLTYQDHKRWVSVHGYAEKARWWGTFQDITQRRSWQQSIEAVEAANRRLMLENAYLRQRRQPVIDEPIAESPLYRETLAAARHLAKTDHPLLLYGETGVGKAYLARFIHEQSKRSHQPFISFNCADADAIQLEEKLFTPLTKGDGYRPGDLFELAYGGTLYLSRIDQLPALYQHELWRQLPRFRSATKRTSPEPTVRLILGSHFASPETKGEDKQRVELAVPPLRERREDIRPLAEYFLARYARKYGKELNGITREAVERLIAYDYPGNVRELANLIERGVLLESGRELQAGGWLPGPLAPTEERDLLLSFDDMQRRHILQALRLTNGRVSGPHGAATLLKLNDKTLFAKMRKLGVGRTDYRGDVTT